MRLLRKRWSHSRNGSVTYRTDVYKRQEHIPIDYQTAVMAEEFNMNLSTCALNGGEDYELLFTVPISRKFRIKSGIFGKCEEVV